MARIGLIGGSGLATWGGAAPRHLRGEAPYGPPSAPLALFEFGATELLFLPRHGAQHSIAPHRVNYRANLHALYEHGAERIVAVNAVGSLDRSLAPGDLVLPDQLIDYTWGREHSFRDGAAAPLAHVEFGEPFDAALRRRLRSSAAAAGEPLRDGACLGVTQGPRLETAAEIRRLARDGCDLVGMTTQPEASLARELGLPYACLAVVANLAAGLEEEAISMAAIEATLASAMERARRVLEQLLETS